MEGDHWVKQAGVSPRLTSGQLRPNGKSRVDVAAPLGLWPPKMHVRVGIRELFTKTPKVYSREEYNHKTSSVPLLRSLLGPFILGPRRRSVRFLFAFVEGSCERSME